MLHYRDCNDYEKFIGFYMTPDLKDVEAMIDDIEKREIPSLKAKRKERPDPGYTHQRWQATVEYYLKSAERRLDHLMARWETLSTQALAA